MLFVREQEKDQFDQCIVHKVTSKRDKGVNSHAKLT